MPLGGEQILAESCQARCARWQIATNSCWCRLEAVVRFRGVDAQPPTTTLTPDRSVSFAAMVDGRLATLQQAFVSPVSRPESSRSALDVSNGTRLAGVCPIDGVARAHDSRVAARIYFVERTRHSRFHPQFQLLGARSIRQGRLDSPCLHMDRPPD